MTLASLRKMVHSQVDKADEAQLLAMLRVVEGGLQGGSSLPDDAEFLAELERRVADYESGKSELITLEESQRRAMAILGRE